MRIPTWIVALLAVLPGLCLLSQAVGTVDAISPEVPLRVIFTADTEGHLDACQSCPGPVGLGGLARRATAVRQSRAAGPLLLLDGGNSAFGDETVASQGGGLLTAYDAIGYDVVNVCYRDFRYGKAQAVRLFGGARAVAVSANLLDAATGEPIFHPYTVRPLGGRRVGVIGLTDAPAGLAVLPRLKRQLYGVRIDSPDAALAKWLPRARAESDQVILLFYGSPTTLNAMSPERRGQCALILLGSVRPDELPVGSTQLYAAEQHGRSLTLVTAGNAPECRLVSLDAAVPRDREMEVLLSKYQAPPVDLPAVSVAAPPRVTEQSPTTLTLPAVAVATSQKGTEQPPMTRQETPTPGQPTAPLVTPPAIPVSQPPPSAPGPANRVAAHQNLTPRGLEAVGLTAEQVNSAIDRGAAFLWNDLKTEDLEKRHHKLGDDQEHVLACLALVHAGAAKKFPDFDRELRAYLTRSKSQTVQETYQSGLLCMLIESYGDPRFFRQQRAAARYLVESQGPQGSWTYIVSVPADPGENADNGPPLRVLGAAPGSAGAGQGLSRTSDWKVGNDGDNSCSQFALLGLHSASRCNNRIAAELWRRSLEINRRRQAQDGGWGYREDDPSSYGSMTCAGLCAVAMDLYELGNPHPELDESIERGLAWMDRNFSVTENPQKGNYLYYYLYSLERVGRILDTEFIGSHEWYPLGARKLVDSQEQDGRWLEKPTTGDDPRVPSSFALLFLTRATPKLQVEVKHGGPGTLRAEIESAPPSQLYVILDASGSMIDLMDGQQKFDVARNAVSALIDALPDTTQAALRVYGHRKRSIEPDSDEDSALEIRMGPLDRPSFAAKLKSLRARGKTPLALSLTQAMSDLDGTSAADPVTLVLLTDGGEDTMPRRDPVKVAAQLSKHPGITFHIVGFDINQEDWGRQLRAMAEVSGGHYWPAARPRELSAQLIAAVFGRPDGFVVVGQDGRQVCTGRFGQPLSLPEGAYVLKTTYGESEFAVPFSIATDTTTSIMFDASHARGHAGAAGPASTATPAPVNVPPTSAPPRFCTHCGHALPPGAKFCPTCGQPVGH